ncbi:hypothetical protein DL93DRAFT_1317978 [Clavulina sp. PMI_390]|nr:hypothetical protein DL93DRAFT_1317978 [Clavulina sp. PMI_390]
MSLPPGAMRRLMKEVATLRTSPPEGLRIVTSEEDMLDLVGIIAGPEGTPYEGGYFRIRFQFTEEFPAAPPKCTMLTKIFHPNVSKAGEICVNTLKKDWKREYGIQHILVTVRCLLIYPNAESALDESAGKLLLENYDAFAKHAKLITSVHATPRTRPPEFDIPSAPQASSSASNKSTSTPSPAVNAVPGPSRSPSTMPSAEPSHASTKPLSKASSTTGLVTMIEPAEPLQLSTSNNSMDSRSTTTLTTSSAGAPISRAGTPMKENTPSGVVTGAPNGSLQTDSKAPPAVKRPGAVGGVAKRKKGLKRL